MIRLCERDEEAQRSTTVDGSDGEMKRDHERDDEINSAEGVKQISDNRKTILERWVEKFKEFLDNA